MIILIVLLLLALFVFIIAGAIHRAKQQKKIADAAEKYLHS